MFTQTAVSHQLQYESLASPRLAVSRKQSLLLVVLGVVMAPLGAADKAAIDTMIEGFLRTKPHPGPELPRACFACICTYLVCGSVLYGVFCPPTLARALWR